MSGIPGEEHDELRTISEPMDDPTGPAPLFVLRVTAGKDNGKSKVLDWNATPRVLVGQSQVSDLVLDDARVSRRHLAFAPDGHLVRVTDLGTTNGTRIGGVRIVDARLEGGESITIGGTTLRLVRAGTLPDGPPARGKFGRVLGRSHEMQRVMALAERVVSSPLPMLLEGEAGTGKQLLAEAIHDGGARALGPFIIFDASAHTGDEQLSLLFGREQPGAIEQASGGTLVIDEIGDLTEAAQARLVPVIERGQLQRVDASGSARVDVRILATTRRDVERLVQDGTFREELLYRLAGLRLEMPPLRARHGDVDLLARHFWTLYGGTGELPKSFALSLARYEWPGNVRELEHAVARRIASGDDSSSFQPPARPSSSPRGGDYIDEVLERNLAMPHARQIVLHEFETRYVEQAIAAHGGNVSRAAAASGLTRRYFHMLRAKPKPEGGPVKKPR